MELWLELARCLDALRPACSRLRTFGWLSVALLGLCARRDLVGVTSLVRFSWLKPAAYKRLLHLFHSSAVHLDRLTECWCALVLRLFRPYRVGGRIVCLADGLQIPKEGRKMPGVKTLFNPSTNSLKKRFFMGHMFHVITMLAETTGSRLVSIPLISRITEGVRFPDQPQLKRPATLAGLFLALFRNSAETFLLVTDSYFAVRTLIQPLLAAGNHSLARLRLTSIAYESAVKPARPSRGRPKRYGARVVLRELFLTPERFTETTVRIYDQTLTVNALCLDLYWKPLGQLVRFVLVMHPSHPNVLLMSTDRSLSAAQIITTYGHRFKIEHGFKQAKHTLGSYAYHFWMAIMEPIRPGSGDQSLEDRAEAYRAKVRTKLEAYHRFVQLGCIAQGLLLHLSVNFSGTVWASFRSWIRTIRDDVPASEAVVGESLRSSFPVIFRKKPRNHFSFKFLADWIDPAILPDWFDVAA